MYYRAVDGLRAIAVLLVLLFHAGLPWLQGGFVGVDVFFVVSGFLITGNILREKEEGRFSFARFYGRRAVRLFPTLFVTITLTLGAGFFFLSPSELVQASKSAVAASFSFSNVYFWNATGYFDTAAERMPLLHTWSLGVEEQFYLVWPLLVAFSPRRIWVVTGLASLGLASLAAAVYLDPLRPSAVFFLTQFRVFQFALGGLIAAACTLKPGVGRASAACLGVVALGAISCIADGSQSNVWLNMVAPALAASAFIWGAESKPIEVVFASLPLRWLGQNSYSIYLAHWPIGFLWNHAEAAPLGLVKMLGIVAASIIAGAVLHWSVEHRFRIGAQSPTATLKGSLAVTGVLFVVAMGGAGAAWVNEGFPQRLNGEIQLAQHRFEQTLQEVETVVGPCVLQWDRQTWRDYNEARCAPGREGDRPSYLVLGDSWASNSYLVLRAAYPELHFDAFSVAGCRIRPVDDFGPKEMPSCRDMFAYAFDRLARSNRYDGVILSSSWDAPYQPVADMVDMLTHRGLQVVIVGQYLVFRQNASALVFQSGSFKDAQARLDAAADRLRVNQDVAMRTELVPTEVVSMIPLQCAPSCAALAYGEMMYRDTSHLTLVGAEVLGARLRQSRPELFPKRAP